MWARAAVKRNIRCIRCVSSISAWLACIALLTTPAPLVRSRYFDSGSLE